MEIQKIRNLEQLLSDTVKFTFSNFKTIVLKLLLIRLFEVILLGFIFLILISLYIIVFDDYTVTKAIISGDYFDVFTPNISMAQGISLNIIWIIIAALGFSTSFLGLNFVPNYLELYQQNENSNITLKEIYNLSKPRIHIYFKYLKFFLLWSIPLCIAYYVVSSILIVTIIGPSILPIILFAFLSLSFYTLNNYFKNPLTTLKKTYNIYRLKTSEVIFAPILLSIGIGMIYLILSLFLESLATNSNLIAKAFNIVALTDPDSLYFRFVMVLTFLFYIIFFTIVQVLIQVQQGFVYYSYFTLLKYLKK